MESISPDAARHVRITPSILYFGTPVVLVVTLNPDGRPNITPISSAWALGASVVLGLGAAGQGLQNLQRDRECTLNFPAFDLWPRVEAIARTTGRDPPPPEKAALGFVHAADKFALGGFTSQASVQVRPPRVEDCPLQFEARLSACHRLTADTAPAAAPAWIAEVTVVQVHARADLVEPGTQRIDPLRWNPLFYVFRHYVGGAANLGRNFRAKS